MPVHFQDFPGSHRDRLRKPADRAMEALEWDGQLTATLGIPPGESQEANAGATDSGLWINPKWMRSPDNDDLVFTFVMYEEVAHGYLGAQGVPHEGPFAVMLQEAYAVWVATSILMDDDDLDWDRLVAQPVPDEAAADPHLLYYFVGRLLGCSMAGSTPHRTLLEDWLASRPTPVPPVEVPAVEVSRRVLAEDWTDQDLAASAETFADLWKQAPSSG